MGNQVSCPHCSSTQLQGKGESATGRYRWYCSQCDKSFCEKMEIDWSMLSDWLRQQGCIVSDENVSVIELGRCADELSKRPSELLHLFEQIFYPGGLSLRHLTTSDVAEMYGGIQSQVIVRRAARVRKERGGDFGEMRQKRWYFSAEEAELLRPNAVGNPNFVKKE